MKQTVIQIHWSWLRSIFIEKELGPLTIGVDYVPDALETETAEQTTTDKTTSATAASVTNTVQVDFEDLTTVYAALNLGESGAYVKAGHVMVDINTNESLGTGSTYGNTDITGVALGVGYSNDFGNGMFIRAEGTYMEFDGTSLTFLLDLKRLLDNLDGVTGKISVGKSF